MREGAGPFPVARAAHRQKAKIRTHQGEEIGIASAPPPDTTRSLRRAPAMPASIDCWQTATEPSCQGGEELQEAVRSAAAGCTTRRPR